MKKLIPKSNGAIGANGCIDTDWHDKITINNFIGHLSYRIFIKDCHSVYVYCNDLYAADMGLTPEQLIGKNDYDIHPFQLADEYIRDDREVLRTGKEKSITEQYQVSGKTRWVRTTKKPYRDERGQIIGVLGIFEDITEARQIEKTLKKSESRLRESQRIAQIGTWELDITTNHVFWSEETYHIFEVDPEEFTPSYQAYLEMVHPEDRDRVDQHYKDSFENHNRYEIEHQLLFKDGKIKWVHNFGKTEFNQSGSAIRLIGTVQDVTRVSLLQQELMVKSQAIEASIDAIAIASLDGRLQYVNQAFLDLWGETQKEDVLGRPATSFWNDPNQALEIINELKSKSFWFGEMMAKRKDGTLFPTLLSATNVSTPGGKTSCIMASFVDITIQKQIEKRLRHKEKEYRLLVENQEDLICRWYPDTTLTFVNKSYCTFFGKSREHLLGQKWLMLIPENSREDIARHYEDLASNPAENRYVHQAMAEGGRIVWQEWIDIPIFDQHGKKLLEFQSIGRDITEQYLIKEKYKYHSELFDKIVHTTSEAYWLVGSELRLLDVNEKACKMLGYTREELLQMAIPDIEASESAMEVEEHTKEVLKTGYDIFEARHRAKDGRIIDVEIRAIKWKTSDNEPLSVGFIRDITDLKKTLSYKNNLEKAKQASQLKSNLLRHISHELLTPMNSILGFSQNMANDPGIGNEHQIKAGLINQSAMRLLKIIKQITDYSDIELTKANLKNEPFDFSGLIEASVKRFIFECEKKGIAFTSELDDRTPRFLIGDKEKLSTVLESLLENALSFTSQGTIVLRVWPESTQKAMIEDSMTKRIWVEVEDSGVGIDKQRLDRLFYSELFSNNIDNWQEGLGLGLSISRYFIQMMGGDIIVDSEPGKGSCFRFNVTLQTIAGDKPDEAGPTHRLKKTEKVVQVTSWLPTCEQILKLPGELKARLRKALDEGDMDMFHELLNSAGQSHPELIKGLRRLADEFNYDKLDELLGKGENV